MKDSANRIWGGEIIKADLPWRFYVQYEWWYCGDPDCKFTCALPCGEEPPKELKEFHTMVPSSEGFIA